MPKSELETRLAQRARAILAAQGISVSEYAASTGQSPDMASRRLNGKARFTVTDLDNFAKMTGYTPIELIDDAFVLKPVVKPSPTVDGGVR